MSTCKGSIITYATFTNPKEKKAEAKKNNLVVGKALTKEQIIKLDKDIVWYEYQSD